MLFRSYDLGMVTYQANSGLIFSALSKETAVAFLAALCF